MEDVHNGLLCCVWEGKPICVPTHHKYTPKAKSYLQYVQCYTHAAPLLITTGMYPLSLKGRLIAAHFKCFYFPYTSGLETAHQKALSPGTCKDFMEMRFYHCRSVEEKPKKTSDTSFELQLGTLLIKVLMGSQMCR